jgi:hypothetical protein
MLPVSNTDWLFGNVKTLAGDKWRAPGCRSPTVSSLYVGLGCLTLNRFRNSTLGGSEAPTHR